MKRICAFVIAAGLAAMAALAAPVPVDSPSAACRSGSVVGDRALGYSFSSGFEQNIGQTDARARFTSRGLHRSVFFTPTAAVFVMASQLQDRRPQANVVRMEFVGSHTQEIEGIERLPGTANYVLGNNPSEWKTGVPIFGKLRYKRAYSNIDIVFYEKGREMEYDFIAQPSAALNDIRLRFIGAQKVELDPQGDLLVHVTGGMMRQLRPNVYQIISGIRHDIAGAYVMHGNGDIGFHVGAYDRGQPLVIDPVLAYSTYLGGSSGDDLSARNVTADGCGNTYVVGDTYATNFPTTTGVVQTTNAGNSDVFVAKFGPTGSLLFSTYVGGAGDEGAFGVAVDSSGNSYFAGYTTSTNFPTTGGAYQTTSAGGGGDGFVAKLNATGTALTYATYLGGSGYDEVDAIALDGSGNAHVVGYAGSTNFPTTTGVYQTSKGGGTYDGFVAKLNSSGTGLSFSTYLGGSSTDGAQAVALDASGNVYVVGYTESSNFPTSGAYQGSYGGSGDAFVTKLNSTGTSVSFSTYFGGNGFEEARSVAVDIANCAYVAGDTASSNFPTANAYQGSHGGGAKDVFAAKFASSGSSLVYSTFLGGSGSDGQARIAVDAVGGAFVAGVTDSSNFPTANAIQSSKAGSVDAFVTRLNAAGSALVYSTYHGGSGEEGLGGLAVDSWGYAYISGVTLSSDFPTTAGAYQTTRGGSRDTFVTKINPGPSCQ